MTTQETVKKTTPSPHGDKSSSSDEKKKSPAVSENNKQSGITSKSQTHQKPTQKVAKQTEKVFTTALEQKDRVEGWLKKEGIWSGRSATSLSGITKSITKDKKKIF
jgi:hypothetical protein